MLEERAGIEHDVYRHQMKIWRISQETKNCEPMTRFPELQPLVPQQENGGEIRFPGLSRSPAAVVPLQLRVLLLQRRRIELALSEINKPQRSSPEPPQPATDDPRHFDPVDPQQFISRPFISEETFTMDIFDEVEQQDAAFSSNATPQAHHDETLASTFERSSSSASNVLGFFESDLVQNRYNMFD
uniref:Uncharacterized protein n=1 Tax=Entomoneis paludosa TaxID=265537 RepID=A0A7S2YET0_9STRA|mmetsp:Transcript_30034/g.62757  ORF Transcript_30034/g.62757 Transcript_30034/m.62757 type:complete len:186 (+) Transcript_30034:615-1172(+)